MYALRLCLIQHVQSVRVDPETLWARFCIDTLQGTSSEAFICHGVQLLALTLTNEDKIGASADAEIDVSTAAGVVDCLLLFVKGP